MNENIITEKIIGCAIKVHKILGPGLLESAYKECLCYEIMKSGLYVEKEKPVPLIYEEVKLECGYRIDLLIERRVIVEIKSVDILNDIHLAQVLTYLKLTHNRIGLLMNFNVLKLIDGVKGLLMAILSILCETSVISVVKKYLLLNAIVCSLMHEK